MKIYSKNKDFKVILQQIDDFCQRMPIFFFFFKFCVNKCSKKYMQLKKRELGKLKPL